MTQASPMHKYNPKIFAEAADVRAFAEYVEPADLFSVFPLEMGPAVQFISLKSTNYKIKGIAASRSTKERSTIQAASTESDPNLLCYDAGGGRPSNYEKGFVFNFGEERDAQIISNSSDNDSDNGLWLKGGAQLFLALTGGAQTAYAQDWAMSFFVRLADASFYQKSTADSSTEVISLMPNDTMTNTTIYFGCDGTPTAAPCVSDGGGGGQLSTAVPQDSGGSSDGATEESTPESLTTTDSSVSDLWAVNEQATYQTKAQFTDSARREFLAESTGIGRPSFSSSAVSSADKQNDDQQQQNEDNLCPDTSSATTASCLPWTPSGGVLQGKKLVLLDDKNVTGVSGIGADMWSLVAIRKNGHQIIIDTFRQRKNQQLAVLVDASSTQPPPAQTAKFISRASNSSSQFVSILSNHFRGQAASIKFYAGTLSNDNIVTIFERECLQIDDGESSSGLGAGAILGLTVGILCLCTLCGTAVFFIVTRVLPAHQRHKARQSRRKEAMKHKHRERAVYAGDGVDDAEVELMLAEIGVSAPSCPPDPLAAID